MKTIIIIFSYVLGFGELWLSGYFWRTHSGNTIRKSMAFLSLATALWVLSTTVGIYAGESDIINLAVRLTYVFGVLMVTSVAIFTILFPVQSIAFDRWHFFFLMLPVGIFSVLMLGSGVIVDSYTAGQTVQGTWFGGPLYNLYNGYLVMIYSLAIVLLVKKIKRTDGIMKKNTILAFWSLLLGGLPGVVNDLIIPFVTNRASTPAIGTLSTAIWLGMTSYIVLKK